MFYLYIHGFGSSGQGEKVTLLRERFGTKVLAPSLSYVPSLAIDTLEQMILSLLKSNQEVGLIGSSLGGYYAIYLAEKYHLKAVLINPSIYPYKTLAKWVGFNRNFYDQSQYEFTQNHLQELLEFEVLTPCVKNYLLLLQSGDEVLDYKEAMQRFEKGDILLEKGGSHGYENFESKFGVIATFLR